MIHFTILHIFILVFLFVFFALLSILAYKQTPAKIFPSVVFANFLVFGLFAFLSIIVIDKYTKKARVENFQSRRVLLNESIVFSGQIRNIGKFKIGKCKLEVKLVNNLVNAKNISGSDIFSPTSGLGFLFKDKKPSSVSETFVVANNLNPREFRHFSVSMKFPPYFQKTSFYHYLTCH